MLLLMKGFSHEHCGDDYEGLPKSIRLFWICREPVTWAWCNLAPSQRRPYCAAVKGHSPMGLVIRQWDAVDWACVFCDHCIRKDWASRSASSWQCACLPYSSCAGFFFFFFAKHHTTQVCQLPYSLYLAPCDFGLFPKPKLLLKWGRSVNAAITAHKLSQRHLTADWLAPWESDCSWMHIKVCSSWLSGYIKAIWPILKIFNMAMCFPGGPHMCLWSLCGTGE
jgi:hypothetical protein